MAGESVMNRTKLTSNGAAQPPLHRASSLLLARARALLPRPCDPAIINVEEVRRCHGSIYSKPCTYLLNIR